MRNVSTGLLSTASRVRPRPGEFASANLIWRLYSICSIYYYLQMEDKLEQNSFLPDFCGIRTVFAVVVSAELLAMVLSLAAMGSLEQFMSELSVRSLYVQWIALSSAALLCLLGKFLRRLNHAVAGIVAWLLIFSMAAMVAELAIRLTPVEILSSAQRGELLVQTLGISGIMAAILLRYMYENHQQKQRELAESRARFQALQARIRPHFLFNSMNAIASLIGVAPEKAEELVHDLSDLFRASMAGENQLSTLDQEIELARQYLSIEQQRLGERLKINWDVDNLPGETAMPPLILQPLVENAVYYGVEPVMEGGEIGICGRYRQGVIALTVSNRFPPEGTDSPHEGNHMALDNVNQRLRAVFGEDAGINTSYVDDLYQARIHFRTREPMA